ncbi:hypothetical protein Ancab_039866 [Ancistrocladus abbreviatus]
MSQVGSHSFESTEFSVGGYRWAIQIYPHGNENENGEGHISIYLRLCDKLKSGSVINVIFRALVYDYERNKYLVIQDLREKRFDGTNTMCGMSRALPLSAFYTKSNGFFIQDRCTFGAEVFIINATIPTSAEVCNMESGRDRSYTWRIERFSELPNSAYSPEFTVEGRTWKLNAWPGGSGTQKGKSFSLYLCLCQYADLAAGNKLHVEYELRLKNQLNGEDRKGTCKRIFTKSSSSWGLGALVPITDLHIQSKGLMMDDVVILQVCIKQMLLFRSI